MKTLIRPLQTDKHIDAVFDCFCFQPDAVFLDSSLHNDLGRYSIIGLNPWCRLRVDNTGFYVNGLRQHRSLEEWLPSFLQEHYEKNTTELPLLSGAIGYFSYDYGRRFENISSQHPPIQHFPDCILNFYDNLIIADHQTGELFITASGQLGDAETTAAAVENHIQNSPSFRSVITPPYTLQCTSDFTKSDYLKAIDAMIHYIVEGDIYIANMTRRLYARSRKAPYDFFKDLRIHNPSPFGAYLNYGSFQIISASPERFLKLRNDIIETRPIKGTRRRGTTEAEDQQLKDELRQSSKDQSELLMIVDLERNDLNRVCVPGSVRVTELFEVETYATVFHLVSTITGALQPDKTPGDLIPAAFPGGSITGAPKIRAMELIDALEHSRRGLYTGSIGYLTLDGEMDLNIVIRSALYQNGCYTIGVGGGITCESDLEFEFEETEQKARALIEQLQTGGHYEPES